MKEEIDAFLHKATLEDQSTQLEDVYVTNHEQKDKKFFTASQKEDQQFYQYKKAVSDYNAKKSSFRNSSRGSRYE